MSAGRVEEIATAVVDGDSVDWRSVDSLLGGGEDQALVTQLRYLSSFSALAPHAINALPQRLPFVLRVGKRIAAMIAVIGIACAIVIWASGRPAVPWVFLLGIGFFGGAALWLDVTGRRDRRALALAGAYWSAASAFAHEPVVVAWQQYLPGDLLVQNLRPEALLPAFLWQFAHDFPQVTRFTVVDRLTKAGVIVATAASVLLVVANLAAPAWGASVPLLTVLQRSYELGRWYWLVVFVGVIGAFLAMIIRGELADREPRRHVRVFLWTIVASLGPVAVIVALESVSPAFAAYTRSSTGRVVSALLVYPAMFAFPLATAYVVLMHDVLDIQTIAQRVLRYLLARWLVAWGAAIPIVTLGLIVYLQRAEPLATVLSTPQAKLLVYLSAFAVVLLLLRRQLLVMVDRWMLAVAPDPAATLAQLGHELRNARTLMELSALVAAATARTLQSEAEVFLVEDGETLVGASDGRGVRLRNSLVGVLLQGAGGPCVVEPTDRGSYFALLSADDREWIRRESIVALCPITPHDVSAPAAVIALKARRNAFSVSRAEMQFLSAVSAAAALAHAGLTHGARPAPPHEEELALQCLGCARVESWRVDAPACECGGTWERAALPIVVAERVRLVSLVGRGGMGVVYRAQDLLLHRHVAVKTLPRLSVAAAERLIDEARAMASLSHPHIAVLFGAERWRGTPVLIVEYFEGGTLADRLRKQRLPLDTALDIGIALAGTLAYMHGMNRCHGDIKPSNIGFSAQGLAKFLDFGLSRAVEDSSLNAAGAGGTLAYLSPEVLGGESPGPHSDVWALSVVLFEMLAGYHPFVGGGDIVERIQSGFTDDIRVRSQLPLPVIDLLRQLLSAAPHVRPADAQSLTARLEDVRISSLERL